ncbi:MAG: TIM barrel protein [Planctomycetota bacterium]
MELTAALCPSVLLSETHFPYLARAGVMADAVARVAQEGFYRWVEIPRIAEKGDRRRIAEVVREKGLGLTVWMSSVLEGERLNLSSVDEELRWRSAARMRELAEEAAECGAGAIALLSGPDPGATLRPQATEQLMKSLEEICGATARLGTRVLVEPLDREAHKKHLLGPTAEFVALFRRLRGTHGNAAVSWDSAHVALCGENIFESFEAAKDMIGGIHLANAVLDREDKRFGDWHMEIGSPGFLTAEGIAEFFRRGIRSRVLRAEGPSVAVEIRTPASGDPWQTEQRGRRILEEAWARFEKG